MADGHAEQAAPPIAWSADDAALERLCWRHALLTVATLGIYRFWAKTEMRRHIWNSIRIHGRPLRYTGTVRELAMPVVIIGLGAIAVAAAVLLAKWLFLLPKPRLTPSPWRFVVTIPLIYVMGLGVWRARAYLLSRTLLAEKSGTLSGNRFSYAAAHFGTALLMPLTLGLALPFRQIWLQRRLIGGMSLGEHRFDLEGSPRPLLKRFAVAWLWGAAIYLAAVLAIAFAPLGAKIAVAARSGPLPAVDAPDIAVLALVGGGAILSIACLAAWYRAGVLRHLAGATRIGGRALHLDLPTWAYVRLAAANTLMKLASLMLLAPLAELRHTRFVLSRLTLR